MTYDFEALRRERNAAVRAQTERLAKEYGLNADEVVTNFDEDKCYCACSTGGPCEHDWDGPEYISQDGLLSSATCSKCGTLAYTHSLRTGS